MGLPNLLVAICETTPDCIEGYQELKKTVAKTVPNSIRHTANRDGFQALDFCGKTEALDFNFRLKMKFLDWYLKIALVSAMIGGPMELFMIKTGFYDKVTVLESEKKA
ncbi:Uncharacterized protein Fot_21946 [Forsythia ovata]|uniref:Uncharacterized protein n=1 Tax=Forsythia ovata TaxID=205694 RepID=A0ABD1UWB5_9LAMI